MTDTTSLLIELGTEELPVKALPGLAQAFFDGVIDALAKRGIAFERDDAKPLYTPRRLAVLLPSVAIEQPRTGLGSARPLPQHRARCRRPADAARCRASRRRPASTGRSSTRPATTRASVSCIARSSPARAPRDLLPEIVREAIAAMPIPKPMRWGDHDYAFARPLHWLVLLLGGDVVDGELFGIRADRMSRGHRFMHDKPVWIGRPEDYVDALRGAQGAGRSRRAPRAHRARSRGRGATGRRPSPASTTTTSPR